MKDDDEIKKAPPETSSEVEKAPLDMSVEELKDKYLELCSGKELPEDSKEIKEIAETLKPGSAGEDIKTAAALDVLENHALPNIDFLNPDGYGELVQAQIKTTQEALTKKINGIKKLNKPNLSDDDKQAIQQLASLALLQSGFQWAKDLTRKLIQASFKGETFFDAVKNAMGDNFNNIVKEISGRALCTDATPEDKKNAIDLIKASLGQQNAFNAVKNAMEDNFNNIVKEISDRALCIDATSEDKQKAIDLIQQSARTTNPFNAVKDAMGDNSFKDIVIQLFRRDADASNDDLPNKQNSFLVVLCKLKGPRQALLVALGEKVSEVFIRTLSRAMQDPKQSDKWIDLSYSSARVFQVFHDYYLKPKIGELKTLDESSRNKFVDILCYFLKKPNYVVEDIAKLIDRDTCFTQDETIKLLSALGHKCDYVEFKALTDKLDPEHKESIFEKNEEDQSLSPEQLKEIQSIKDKFKDLYTEYVNKNPDKFGQGPPPLQVS
ncbi:MAG: hypothetical protein AAF621_05745 [Pseudomonadota bacterium]